MPTIATETSFVPHVQAYENVSLLKSKVGLVGTFRCCDDEKITRAYKL